MPVDPLNLVIQIHAIAKQLEQHKHLEILAMDLKKLADQVSRVHANHCVYTEAFNKLDPIEKDYIEYLAHLGE